MKINSYNEWDRLREVIVGKAEGKACLIFSGPSYEIPEETRIAAEALARQAFPQWLIDEVNEDLQELCGVLAKFGAKVYRPDTSDTSAVYSTPNWTASGDHVFNARDLYLVVGNALIESPSQEKHRYFEATGYYDIFYQYFKDGFRWIAGPKPRLTGDYKVTYHEDGKKYIKLNENEILFEAANTVRMGKDLLYLVSRSGNYLGAQWLQSVLGAEYRVHTTEEIYRSNHIDSTVLCLRPGLVLLNAQRVNSENCPKILDKWDKIYFTDILPIPEATLEFQAKVRTPIFEELARQNIETNIDSTSSEWIGMNFLSLDPETLVVDKRQAPLIKLLEKHRFTVIPVSARHSYFMGGIHCNTLDTVRDGKLENYFD